MKKQITTMLLLAIVFTSCKKEQAGQESAFTLLDKNNQYNLKIKEGALTMTDAELGQLLKEKWANMDKIHLIYPGSFKMPYEIKETANKPADCNAQYTAGVNTCSATFNYQISSADYVRDMTFPYGGIIGTDMHTRAVHNYSVCLTTVAETHNNCH